MKTSMSNTEEISDQFKSPSSNYRNKLDKNIPLFLPLIPFQIPSFQFEWIFYLLIKLFKYKSSLVYEQKDTSGQQSLVTAHVQ